LLNCETETTISRPGADSCAWMRMGTRRFTSTAQGEGFHEASTGAQGGADFAFDSGWRIGGGVSIEAVDNNLSDFSTGDGWRAQFGLSAMGQLGPLDIEAAVSAGTQQLDEKRKVLENTTTDTAAATQTLWFETGTARIAHEFDMDKWFARPLVDLTIGGVQADGLRERGASALSLHIDGSSQFTARITPAVEFGWKWTDGNITIRPFARAGLRAILTGEAPEVDAMFAGAPSGTAHIVAKEPVDRLAADVQGGLAIVRDDGLSVNVYYAGQFGSTAQDNRFGANIHVPF
jgi:uncharacterized protein with beta-barrel porin domain